MSVARGHETAGCTAMVLCAGFGTRLRPLTEERPKPLVPLGDRPVLLHVLDQLARFGHGNVVVNTHHASDVFLEITNSYNLTLKVIHEPEIRGTAGGVAGARGLLGAPVVVWNGDVIARPPLASLQQQAREHGSCLAIAPRDDLAGTVGLDEDGWVVRLRGRRFGKESRSGDYIGVCALGADALARLPERGCLVGDWWLPALERGEQLPSVPIEGGWTDVGSLGAYLEANLRWAREQAGSEPRGVWWGEGARVDPGIDLRDALLGAGSRVIGQGRLERCVLWPGAQARAPLCDAVVTSRGTVVRVAPPAGISSGGGREPTP